MNRFLWVLCTLAVASLPAAADAFWGENFDQYAPGTSLHGVNGWEGWLHDPSLTGYVSDLYARSLPNSCRIQGLSDLVHPYSGYTRGFWQYTTWMYIPEEFSGQTYFILLNTYGAASNWSVQVGFENGQVVNSGVSGGTLPWILGEWVELRVAIDLDSDHVTFYYGGDVLYTGTWTQEVSGNGVCALTAVDLFANFATPVYYDDMWIGAPVPTEQETWGGVKALFD
jgi:hypothetical protein